MKYLILICYILLISSIVYGQNIKHLDSIISASDYQKDAGLYDEAIQNLLKADNVCNYFNLKEKKTQVFSRLSQIFMIKNQYDKALDYANISLKISKEIKNDKRAGWAYAKIADIKYTIKDYSSAEENYKNAIKSFEITGDKKSKSQMINNLGLLFKVENKLDKAEEYFLEAYRVSKEINFMTFQAYIEEELADNYRMKKDFTKSKIFFDLAMAHEKEANYIVLTQNILNDIHNYYKDINDYSKSLFYFEKYASLTDSLDLINQSQRILEVETRMRTKEKEKEIKFLSKESELQQAQIRKSNVILALFSVIILIVICIVLLALQSMKKISQKNIEIEHQKKEIIDSINYAKRIQDATLGSTEKIKELYNKSAILFQPKDIISGDFYWFNKIGNKFMFSVADCTGHGVPGAMMSMIGNNGLNDSVNSKGLKSPSEILNNLSQYVNKNFIKTDFDVKDGMDIAFCSLDVESGELIYSGALNSLYIQKNNGEFIEIKADKNYIGQIGSQYKDNVIALEKGDCVHIMSDGFVDQFGGEKNKKFKISGFRNLIKEIHRLSPENQSIAIKNAINTWKGSCEQTDDICIISVMF